MSWSKTVLAIAILCLSACGGGETTPEAVIADEDWLTELEDWKARRDERLRQPTGWLSLAGLFWLEEGASSFGSDPAGNLVFPPSAEPRLGTLQRNGNEIRLEPQPDVELTIDGAPASGGVLVADADGEPTVVEHGSLSFYVIRRGERVGVRLKDSASPLLASFEGMDYYPPDPAWRIGARFELYSEPRTIGVPNIIGDTLESFSPGVAIFEVDGREYRLEPTGDPTGELFFVFGDETNGEATYGGGRFLYAGPPAADGSIVLDFNRAYNPPCVFTPYATCPLPRPEDKLALAIEAGEKMFGKPH